jgi:hypothetical protein
VEIPLGRADEGFDGDFIDEQADERQREAPQLIFGGRVGGCPAMMATFIGDVRGMEFARIDFHVDDDLASWRAEIPGKLISRAENARRAHDATRQAGAGAQCCGCDTGPGGMATYGKATAHRADAFGFKWDRTGRSSKHIPFDGPE